MKAVSQAFPTPTLSHLRADDYSRVYEPAEDSFLLMDALEMDLDFLKTRRPFLCLEVGSGSGVVITFLATLLPSTTFSWAVDVNAHACWCTRQTFLKNGISKCDVLTMDLVGSLQERLTGKVDILLFNPPYVVTPSEEVGSSDIVASWAGGENGREVIDRFLPNVAILLSKCGVFYLLLLAQNKPSEVCKMLSRDGLQSKLVISRTAGNEKIYVYKFFH